MIDARLLLTYAYSTVTGLLAAAKLLGVSLHSDAISNLYLYPGSSLRTPASLLLYATPD